MEDINKTKIVCTLGPASNDKEMIEKLAKQGMNVVRFNLSHGTHQEHLKRIEIVREVSKKTGINLSILLDTKGPEIRTAQMENGGVKFESGDIVRIGFDKDYLGNKERFSLQVPNVYDDVQVGNYILIDDGHLRLTVIDKDDTDLIVKAENSGYVKTTKGVNIPDVKLSMPFMSEKDIEDIRFAAQNNVDYIAASFVRRASDVLEIRNILKAENKEDIQIIVKIENQEGVDNIKEILKVSDGVMVARGDLGVEVKSHLVPMYQKHIIDIANYMAKPVITATHMLESMQENPRATRAEINDIANAILDGSDAIMLSGETAVGKYPLESVETMFSTSVEIEKLLPFRKRLDKAIISSRATKQDSIAISIAETCLNMEDVAAVIAFTQSGDTVRRIAKFRPKAPILAVTFDKKIQRSLALNWGVVPIYSRVQNNVFNEDNLVSKIAKEYGIDSGKKVIIVAGYPTGVGTANSMKIIDI